MHAFHYNPLSYTTCNETVSCAGTAFLGLAIYLFLMSGKILIPDCTAFTVGA